MPPSEHIQPFLDIRVGISETKNFRTRPRYKQTYEYRLRNTIFYLCSTIDVILQTTLIMAEEWPPVVRNMTDEGVGHHLRLSHGSGGIRFQTPTKSIPPRKGRYSFFLCGRSEGDWMAELRKLQYLRHPKASRISPPEFLCCDCYVSRTLYRP